MAGNEVSDAKWKDLMDKLSSIEDLQNLTQLDIINLKNEIEKIKLVSTSPIPPEIQERIVELENIAENVEILKKWKQTVEEVKFLRSKVIGSPQAPQATEKKETEEIENMRNDIEQIRKELKTKKFAVPPEEKEKAEAMRKEIEDIRNELKVKKFPPVRTPPINLTVLRSAIKENKDNIEKIKSMILKAPERGLPNIEEIKKMINENRRLVENLKSEVRESISEIPMEVHGELETLHGEITKLESEVKNLKEEKPEETKDEIDSLRKDLFTRLEELNKKFGSAESEKFKELMEENRNTVMKLKSLISSEGITDIKKEVDKNRESIQQLKIAVMRKPEKVMIPPDPEMRKKMLQIEQRIASMGRKLDKITALKPIEIPEFPEKAAMKIVTKGPGIEKLKKDVDSIISRMDDFVTKNEVEKGFLEKRLKTDEKLVTDELEKELNEIKKAVIRNEDQITSIASDVEDVKKEVGTVEKREWAKVSELPEIEDIKRRIDGLEKMVRKREASPVFIE